jgi:NitT/TauT family transport system permease protein
MAVIYRIVLPQIIPRLIHTVRISLGPAWLFLIASEAISSTSDLGYRIFLVRRYLAMDIIIPYVLWITFLGFLMDLILSRFVEWRYPWYSATQ